MPEVGRAGPTSKEKVDNVQPLTRTIGRSTPKDNKIFTVQRTVHPPVAATTKTSSKLINSTKPTVHSRLYTKHTPCTKNIVDNKKTLYKSIEPKKWLEFSKAKDSRTYAQQVNHTSSTPTANKACRVNVGRQRPPVSPAFVTVRKGQGSKGEPGQHQNQDDLSRTSSVSSLNADQKNKGAFAKLRKGVSKEKIDGERKNDRKGVAKNNNKIATEDVNNYTRESLMQELEEMNEERKKLVLQLGEKNGQLSSLKNEISKLKMFQEQSSLQLEKLNEENTALRNRLRDVAYSPLSDNEKQELLQRHHNSAPASIATNLLDDSGGDATTCPTPDWDKQSSGNVSEVSVACLQDKINQMQETHYSTNEELQATLQELTDLQRQLTDLQQDNERLLEEKALMFDSLCRQTERLNDTRTEVESLKQLLYRDKDDTVETIVEREQKLVALLQSAQEERETLLLKQEQLNNEVQELSAVNIEQAAKINQLSERVKTLESTLDAKHAEHKQLDQELAIAKDQSSGRQIEINRLTDLLDNARTKITELEQDRALSDKSELDELLDNARKEKDALESEVAHLKEQVARSKNESEKLREQVSVLQEECKVTRNNAKCTQSELEYKCERLTKEKNALTEQLQQLQEAANELQVQAQCQLEDKRQLSSVLSETQRNLSEAERRNLELENEILDLKRLREEENEEWERFQNDLLTSVRVANDFKTEAQQNVQKLILENKAERERVKLLEAQIDKLKGGSMDRIRLPRFLHSSREDLAKKRHSNGSSGSLPSLNTQTGSLESVKSEKSTLLKNLKAKLTSKKHPKKRLSKNEKEQLELINKLYEEIDPSIPEEDLTETQKTIIKLKKLFDDETWQLKPSLQNTSPGEISPPLKDSVMSNLKLKQISSDPEIKLVKKRSTLIKHEAFFDSCEDSNFIRSKSMNDIQFEQDKKLSTCLKANTTEDLTKEVTIRPFNSRLQLNLTEGTYRFSDSENPVEGIRESRNSFTKNMLEDEEDFRPTDSFLFQPSNQQDEKRVTYANLDKLYNEIDRSKPEESLTKEERFIVKLKTSMDGMGRKNTLKRQPRKNKVEISPPEASSVKQNIKLFDIINNPAIPDVKRDELPRETNKKKFLGKLTIKNANKEENEVVKPDTPKTSKSKFLDKLSIKHDKDKKKAATGDEECEQITEFEPETPKLKFLDKFKVKSNKEKKVDSLEPPENIPPQSEDAEEVKDKSKSVESISSLFEAVIVDSDLQKLIEKRNLHSGSEKDTKFNVGIEISVSDKNDPQQNVVFSAKYEIPPSNDQGSANDISEIHEEKDWVVIDPPEGFGETVLTKNKKGSTSGKGKIMNIIANYENVISPPKVPATFPKKEKRFEEIKQLHLVTDVIHPPAEYEMVPEKESYMVTEDIPQPVLRQKTESISVVTKKEEEFLKMKRNSYGKVQEVEKPKEETRQIDKSSEDISVPKEIVETSGTEKIVDQINQTVSSQELIKQNDEPKEGFKKISENISALKEELQEFLKMERDFYGTEIIVDQIDQTVSSQELVKRNNEPKEEFKNEDISALKEKVKEFLMMERLGEEIKLSDIDKDQETSEMVDPSVEETVATSEVEKFTPIQPYQNSKGTIVDPPQPTPRERKKFDGVLKITVTDDDAKETDEDDRKSLLLQSLESRDLNNKEIELIQSYISVSNFEVPSSPLNERDLSFIDIAKQQYPPPPVEERIYENIDVATGKHKLQGMRKPVPCPRRLNQAATPENEVEICLEPPVEFSDNAKIDSDNVPEVAPPENHVPSNQTKESPSESDPAPSVMDSDSSTENAARKPSPKPKFYGNTTRYYKSHSKDDANIFENVDKSKAREQQRESVSSLKNYLSKGTLQEDSSSDGSRVLRQVPKFFINTQRTSSNAEELDKEQQASQPPDDQSDLSESVDSSFLNLFKSPEQHAYERISGVGEKDFSRPYINFNFFGGSSEGSDSISDDVELRNIENKASLEEKPEKKPQVIDYIPLDPSKPKKRSDDGRSASSDSLERVATQHIFNVPSRSSEKMTHDKYRDMCELELRSVGSTGSSENSGRKDLNMRLSVQDVKKRFEKGTSMPPTPGLDFRTFKGMPKREKKDSGVQKDL